MVAAGEHSRPQRLGIGDEPRADTPFQGGRCLLHVRSLSGSSRGLAALLTHLRGGMGTLAGSGVVGFGMTFRAIAVMVVVVVLAATDARLALAATLLYALAYTMELGVSLALYFSGDRPHEA